MASIPSPIHPPLISLGEAWEMITEKRPSIPEPLFTLEEITEASE